ncbi:MAG: glycosyltransferase [Anaerolineales bacterium]|nr:glycosyltransferase [Anaerolineales bacterium]
MGSVGAVISAYNEGQNVHRVLNTLHKIRWIDRIIVVDDGSTDDTYDVVCQYGKVDPRICAIRLSENSGKSEAMWVGAGALDCDVVLFLDADLIGLKERHAKALCTPVLHGEADMVVGSFHPVKKISSQSIFINERFANPFSGQRCLRTEDARELLSSLRESGFGVEAGLTLHARRRGWRVDYIPWNDMMHTRKEQKRGLIAGLKTRFSMYSQVAATIIEFPRYLL